MSLIPHICHLYGTWKPGALSQLSRVDKRDKTVTARHRETSDREVGTSDCCIVMVQIAVETSLRTKVLLTSNWCLMARKLFRTCQWKRANERECEFIVCITTPLCGEKLSIRCAGCREGLLRLLRKVVGAKRKP
jgi:hypothetical protein